MGTIYMESRMKNASWLIFHFSVNMQIKIKKETQYLTKKLRYLEKCMVKC